MKMMYDLLLRGGKVVFPDGVQEADIAVKEGKIAAILAPNSNVAAKKEMDLTHLTVFPGLIDTHAHFWEPGPQNYREDFYHATRCCAAGGVTTVLEMPLSIPPVVDQASFQLKYDVASANSVVDFGLWGGCTPASIDNMPLLDKLGCCAFKVFISYANPDYPHLPDHEFCRALAEAAKLGALIGVHAENADVVQEFCRRMDAAGIRQPSRYNEGRPPFSEVDAIQRTMLFAKEYGAKVLICHMSAHEGVEATLPARLEGRPVYNETCPHYLAYDNMRMDELGAFAKCNPPLRPRENLEKLWEHVLSGHIDVIGTDHGPYANEEKEAGNDNIWTALPGFGGVEMMLAVMLTDGYARRGLPLERIADMTSRNAARIFGLKNKGGIEIGKDADFAIVDLEHEWVYDGMQTFSKTKTEKNIFHGYHAKGRVLKTIVRGTTVYCDGMITAQSGYGRFVPRSN